MTREHELEVKVLDVDLQVLEARILALGGKLIASEDQTNILLVPPSEDLIPKGSYLRVRTVKTQGQTYSLLTYKALISEDVVRENIETTSGIQSPEAVVRIFEQMGFRAESGRKKRISYELMGARLDLDTWDKETYPYPYMEIEVSDQAALDDILKLLDIPAAHVSKKSIAELQAQLRIEEKNDKSRSI